MLKDASLVLCQSVSLDYPVFLKNDKAISFKKFQNNVAKYAGFFKTLDTDSIILYISDDLYLFYVCFMAILHAGKNVILPAYLTSDNIEDLSNISKYVMTTSELGNTFFNVMNPNKVPLGEAEHLHPIDAENQSVFFFTSGSTSKPKTIEKKFKTLVLEINLLSQIQSEVWDKRPVIISSAMPNHIYGMLWRFLLPLCKGLLQDLDLILFPEEISTKQKICSKVAFITTPSFMNQLANYVNQYTFSNNCIAIYSSGSLLSDTTSDAMFKTFGVSPFEIFASTESGAVAYRQQKNGPSWTFVPDIKWEIDENASLKIYSERAYVKPFIMSDSISLQSDNKFILNGRVDRMVKIAEKRVSLPEMESRIVAYPYIEQAYVLSLEDNSRLILGAVVVLNDDGKEYLKQNGKLNFVSGLRKYLLQYFEAVVIPRKIRIVQQIPTNAQGKLLSRNIAKLFEVKTSEPVMQNVVSLKEHFSADLTFLPDAEYFKGHFPNFPILPGVIQMHFVFYFMEQYFHDNPSRYIVSRLKFMNLIFPNQKVAFVLDKISPDEYTFSYKVDEKICSCGKISIEVRNV